MAVPNKAEATLRRALPYVNKEGESYWQLHSLAASDGAKFWVHAWFGHDWVDFLLSADGRSICVRLADNIGPDRVIPMVLGARVGLALRLQGFTCLHASAALIDGTVIAFTGVPETGKSTTMAALLQRGATFFSDDLVRLAIEIGSTATYPGYPVAGLWPDSMRKLFGPQADLPLLGTSGKHVYTPRTVEDGAQPWPLGAIYLLRARGTEPALIQPKLVPLSQLQAVTELMPHTIGISLRSRQNHANDLARVARLARTIPVRAVERPNDLHQINALVDLILDDVRQSARSLP
jgi:hypothetical protein